MSADHRPDMRAGTTSRIVALGLVSGALGLLSACSKDVKADFPRPPATASVAPPEPDGPDTPEVAGPESEPPPETVETETIVEAVEPEPTPEDPPRRALKPTPPEPESEEPEEPPPSTQLAGTGETSPELVSKLQRAGSLLSAIGERALSSPQREQLIAARSFVSQAREALADGDEKRALVLIDKGLILAEDVERSSRP
ncbi:MAG TPA: hypothetical protein VEK15_28135 [Vicinamibacteria bacterium]|nr:hypothetical protein [Vicinamibacteria bacterium]